MTVDKKEEEERRLHIRVERKRLRDWTHWVMKVKIQEGMFVHVCVCVCVCVCASVRDWVHWAYEAQYVTKYWFPKKEDTS